MVDVAFEIEDMHFDAKVITIVEGRTITDAKHSFPLLAGYMNTNRIDSNGWYQFVGEIHPKIGGREAYLSAYLIATHNGSFQEIVISLVFLGGHDITGKHGTTEGGGTYLVLLLGIGGGLHDVDA